MEEKHPESISTDLVFGTEREVAVVLEDLADELWQITGHAEALTQDHPDRNITWLRQISKPLKDGSTLYLNFTVDRLENNYASVIQEIPAADGGQRRIERRWSNTNPADSSLQMVNSSRTRPEHKKIEDHRRGFNAKDINRLHKLLDMFTAGDESDG
jgi:hypothetical protein